MKTKPHIFILLAFLIVAGMIVSPVCAYYSQMEILVSDDVANITQSHFNDVTSMAFENPSLAIYGINIKQRIDTTTSITMIYGNDSVVTGSTIYTLVFPLYSNRTVELNGESESQYFTDYFQFGQQEFVVSYASNISDSDGSLISNGFMIHNPAYIGQNIRAYFPVSGFSTNLIKAVTITSDKNIDVVVLAAPADIVLKYSNSTDIPVLGVAQDWINFTISIGAQALGFVLILFGVIRFFFIDNLLLTIALYLGVSLAYSAVSSRNIFQFYKKFIRFQRSMLDFMIQLWNYLIQIVSSFRGIFRL
jgi:hypothetical protein